MKTQSIKCDICGKFINTIELGIGGGASSHFVPDTEFTHEELIYRCKADTIKHGRVKSTQITKAPYL